MNTLPGWLSTPVVKALGWALFHFLWEGALIALVLAGTLFLNRRGAASRRYRQACASMLAMATAFGLTFAVAFFMSHPAASLQAGPQAAVIVAAQQSGRAAAIVPETNPWDRLSWFVPFWMAGVLLMGLRSVAGWVSLNRYRSVGVCAAPGHWQKKLEAMAARMAVSKPVALLESCRIDSPMVVGALRPVILAPIGFLSGCPAEHVEFILLHELAHIARRDCLANLFQKSIESLLFYHPAVWWVSKVIRSERENCCDDAVVAVAGDAHAYAAALAELEETRLAAVAASGGSLATRVRRLLGRKDLAPGTAAPALSAVLLLVAIVFSLAGRSPVPENPAYSKWLNEDVAYIIYPAEREAFLKLSTDAERDHFIQQFWARRDPTPDTPENEFKQEHYRRIAYANAHFASDVAAGWKTDRGKAYIIWGPPDEMESHPNGGTMAFGAFTTTSPAEVWRYRYAEGSNPPLEGPPHRTYGPLEPGESGSLTLGFVDTDRDRSYHLAMKSVKPAGAQTARRSWVESAIQEQKLLTKTDPVYPPLARQARIRGVVRFTAIIGTDGRVTHLDLVSGHPLLVRAAQEAVQQWVYQPTLIDGTPVEVITNVDVKFSLQ